MGRISKLPKRQEKPMPRKKSILTYPGFYLIILGLTLFAAGGYHVYLNYGASFLGSRTDAILMSKEMKEEEGKYIKYYFKYRFIDYFGKTHEGMDDVSRKLFSSIEESGTFPIYYIPENTDMRYIPGSRSTMTPAVIAIIGFAILFASTIGLSMYLTSGNDEVDKTATHS